MTDFSKVEHDLNVMENAIFTNAMALYALAQLLEERGIVSGSEWANQLRRYKIPSNPELANMLEAVCGELENNPFGPNRSNTLTVIDGGVKD